MTKYLRQMEIDIPDLESYVAKEKPWLFLENITYAVVHWLSVYSV